MNQESKDIRNLINLLNEYTEAYDKGTPIISDKDWDSMYFKLANLEQETGIIYPDSPTQSINYEVKTELNKVIHNPPMLSLDKTKDIDSVSSFVRGNDWYAMFKMDGLSCRIIYENGQLVEASTRGHHGIEGDDITHNAMVIPSIPKSIPYLDRAIVDGEIICDLKTFNEKFSDDYKTARNFAAGSIRQLSSNICASRNLTFVAWNLVEGCSDIDFNFWRLEKLDDWGFITVPRVGDAETVEDAIRILDQMEEHNIYPIDGYVFKFESKKLGESLGQTEHHAKNALAFKFYDEEYDAELLDIEWSMGRTGVLTPVAIYTDTEIDGTICNRASMHNLSIMRETLGLYPEKSQPIWVVKQNQIIPQISRAQKNDIPHDHILDNGICTNCPICGEPTEIVESETGVLNIVCTNPSCMGKISNIADHYLGVKGLNVKGISKATLEKLIQWGWLKNIKDIYTLKEYREEWIKKPGFGIASVDKILNAIEESKHNVVLANYISAIGIPLVGRTVAKSIVNYYSSWKEFREAVGGDWTEFEGFGPEINNAINSFNFSIYDEIAGMLDFAQPEIQNEVTPTAALKDKKFCATGKLQNFTRNSLKADIEAHGGKLVSSVTSAIDYLITNTPNSGTSKNKDAQRLGVKIITEEEYLKMKE